MGWKQFVEMVGKINALSRLQPPLLTVPEYGMACLATFPPSFLLSLNAFDALVSGIQERGYRN